MQETTNKCKKQLKKSEKTQIITNTLKRVKTQVIRNTLASFFLPGSNLPKPAQSGLRCHRLMLSPTSYESIQQEKESKKQEEGNGR